MPLCFENIRTPPNHLDTLIEPARDRLIGVVEANRRLLGGYDFLLMDVPVGEARAMARQAIAGAADAVVVSAGHQPEFIHPGVWAKHVVVRRLADATGAVALNLVVDQDAPKTTTVDVAARYGERVAVVAVPCGNLHLRLPFENQPPAGADDCQAFAQRVREALGDQFGGSLMPRFLDAYCGGSSAVDWVEQSVGARKFAEAALGITVEDRRVSRFWGGPLMGQVLLDAPRFAGAYNEALATYRARHRVRAPNRPVPALSCRDDLCEVPLWAYESGGPRRRLFVRSGADRIALEVDGDAIIELDRSATCSWQRLERALDGLQWRVRPRALMLTLWARLLVSDLFVHGIGGAQYDRITDLIIETYFGVRPPAMACVSATLHPPIADRAIAPDTLPDARRQYRDIHYNPQRYVESGYGRLIAERAAAIARADRLRREQPRDRVARRQAFLRIRDANARLAAAVAPRIADSEARIAELERRLRDHQVATRRDYFFALYPETMLHALVDRIGDVHDFGG